MTNLLLTGGTGFVGGHFLRQIDTSRFRVFALTRRPEKIGIQPQSKNIQWLPCTDSDQLLGVFKENQIDVVVHLATYYTHSSNINSIDPLLDANVSMGLKLLECMKECGCNRLVNTTTVAEFDAHGNSQPNSLYATTKSAFRKFEDYYRLAYEFKIIDLVLYDNYGPDDTRGKILNLLVNHLQSGEPVDLSPGEQYLNLIHISDTVGGVLKAVEQLLESNDGKHLQKLACLAPCKAITIRELATLLEKQFSAKIRANWGAREYRENEIMVPWVGPILSSWEPKIKLEHGLAGLF